MASLVLDRVTKTYQSRGKRPVLAVDDLNLAIKEDRKSVV